MTTYVQGRILELASGNGYTPLDLMDGVPGFRGYRQIPAPERWSLDRASGLSYRIRSYVVGAGICSLLDQLGAEWKKPAIEELLPPFELLRQVLEKSRAGME